MKMSVEYYEWFPYYSETKKDLNSKEIELTEEEYEFIKKANEDAEKAQDLINIKLEEIKNGK